MKHKTKLFVIGVFLFLNVTDIITTLLAGSKQGFEHEANIFYRITGSIKITFILKWVLVFLMIALFMYKYGKWRDIARYGFFLMLSMMIMTLFVVSINNYLVYRTTPAEYDRYIYETFGEELDDSEIKEYQKENYSNPLTKLFIFCMIVFMFFNWIEKETPKTN